MADINSLQVEKQQLEDEYKRILSLLDANRKALWLKLEEIKQAEIEEWRQSNNVNFKVGDKLLKTADYVKFLKPSQRKNIYLLDALSVSDIYPHREKPVHVKAYAGSIWLSADIVCGMRREWIDKNSK
jgi:hypothetical protein